MRIELHCHSTVSDGTVPAKDVAERAFQVGVELFCLTDHDSCDGYEDTLAAFPDALRGVELSTTFDDRTVHLLLYDRGEGSRWQVVLDALAEQQRVRRERVLRIAERLRPLGVELDAEAVLRESAGVVGRPHVAKMLVEQGYVRSPAEAFDRYLRDGGPGDVRVARLGLAEGLELGREAGASMALAHPHVHGKRCEDILRRHKTMGLTGLEVYYGLYKSKQRRNYRTLADILGLTATGGSDFHGDTLPQILRPGVDIPNDDTPRLLDWLGRAANQGH